jgi:hypothetical protein
MHTPAINLRTNTTIVWRYQRGNQNTMAKRKRTINDLQNPTLNWVWIQVLKGKQFLLRMWHPSWILLCINTVIFFPDLAVALFHILPLSIGHFTRSWSLGLIVCKLQFYISDVALYSSTYLIMTISIDRLLCIVNPMGIMRKMKTFRVGMVAGPWILSLIINVPLLIWTTVVTGCGSQICTPDLRGVREVCIEQSCNAN